MATHSSILAWKIPWTEEPGGLQSVGSQRWTQHAVHADKVCSRHSACNGHDGCLYWHIQMAEGIDLFCMLQGIRYGTSRNYHIWVIPHRMNLQWIHLHCEGVSCLPREIYIQAKAESI